MAREIVIDVDASAVIEHFAPVVQALYLVSPRSRPALTATAPVRWDGTKWRIMALHSDRLRHGGETQ